MLHREVEGSLTASDGQKAKDEVNPLRSGDKCNQGWQQAEALGGASETTGVIWAEVKRTITRVPVSCGVRERATGH